MPWIRFINPPFTLTLSYPFYLLISFANSGLGTQIYEAYSYFDTMHALARAIEEGNTWHPPAFLPTSELVP
jgi:hypothetical protein